MYELHIFGGLELRDEHSASLQSVLLQPKRAALLVYLTLTASGSFVRRETLLAAFWPEMDAEHARGALRTALHRLRASIGDALVTRGNEEVGIDPELLSCDALTARRLIGRRQYDQALALYDGDLLAGMHVDDAPAFHDWLEQQRTEYRTLFAGAAHELARRCEAAGDLPGAIGAARRSLVINPTDETVLRYVLKLHEAAADVAGALQTYQAFENRVNGEYELAISEETRALIEGIRAHAAPLPSPVQASTLRAPRAARTLRAVAAALVVVAGISVVWFAGAQARGSDTLTAWSELQVAGNAPLARVHHVLLYGQADSTITLFGGRNAPTNFGDVWRLKLGAEPAWQKLVIPEPLPRPRWIPFAVLSEEADMIVMHGGALGHTSPCTDETWALEHVSGRSGMRGWRQLQTQGVSPSARADHRGGYDARNDRLIIHGGHNCIQTMFDDAWVLRNATGRNGPPTWQRLEIRNPEAGPGRIRTHSAVYDPVTNRLIVFGGSNGFEEVYNHVWILTHANGDGGVPEWIKLEPRGVPPQPRQGHSAVFDPTTNRMVVYGRNGKLDQEVWVLVGANGKGEYAEWRRILPDGPTPRLIVAHPAAFDERTERLMVVGRSADRSSLYILANVMGR
ncbi:MAG: Kelch repeat-containing protein [Gemmatimonadota bacterium]